LVQKITAAQAVSISSTKNLHRKRTFTDIADTTAVDEHITMDFTGATFNITGSLQIQGTSSTPSSKEENKKVQRIQTSSPTSVDK
jgi:hypothetical protein